jgi:hypothetical protein
MVRFSNRHQSVTYPFSALQRLAHVWKEGLAERIHQAHQKARLTISFASLGAQQSPNRRPARKGPLDIFSFLHQHSSMQNANTLTSLPGYGTVKDWFGVWPDFHDAEVIGLTLARRGESLLRCIRTIQKNLPP